MNSDSSVLFVARPALTIVLGEARSGKTHWSVQQAASNAGVPVLIAPSLREADQLNRAVMATNNGSSAAVTITFPSLTAELLRTVEGGERRILNAALQRLILGDLIKQHIGPGDYLGKMISTPGFVAALQQGVNEWKLAGATADRLEALLQNADLRVPDYLFHRKLPDLIRVLRAYEQFLANNHLSDNTDTIRSATLQLTSRTTKIPYHASLIVFDGFHRYDTAQIEMILALALVGPDAGSGKCRIAVTLSCDEARPLLFASPSRTLRQLRNAFVTEEITLPSRRDAESVIDRLSHRLYAHNSTSRSPGNADQVTFGQPGDSPITSNHKVGAVQIMSAPNSYMEAEMVAREFLRIRSVCRFPWSDFAIVVRNAPDYSQAVACVFERFQIPVSVVATEKLSHNPLIGCLLNLLRIYQFGWQRPDVIAFLKSSYVSADRASGDSVFMAAKRQAIRDEKARWLDRAEQLGDLKTHGLIVKMASLESGVCEAGLTAAVRSQALLDIVQALDLTPKVEVNDLKRAAADAVALRSAAAQLTNLSTLERLRLASPISFADFYDQVVATWSQAGYSRPDVPESVHLVEPLNTREYVFKVAAVMGLTERVFPRRISEDPFLQDGERRAIEEVSGLHLESHGYHSDEERFQFYLAVTAASDCLMLSYPRSGLEHDMQPSFFLDEAEAAGADLISKTHTTLIDIAPRMEIASQAREQRLAALACLFDPFDQVAANSVAAESSTRAAAALQLERDLHSPEASHAVRASILSRNLPDLRALTADDLCSEFFNWRDVVSVAEVNAFAQCPFQFMMRFRLGVEQEPREAYTATKVSIVRQALNRYYAASRTEVVSGAAQIYTELQKIAAEICSTAVPDAAPENREMLQHAINLVLRGVALREYEYNSRFEMTPAAFALSFGVETTDNDPGSICSDELPGLRSTSRPLVLKSDEYDCEVRLTGIIDRIDLDRDGKALILGFTADRSTDYGRMVRGESVDLPLYMLAAERLFNHSAAIGCTDSFKERGRRRLVRTQHVGTARFAPIASLDDETDVRAITRAQYSQLVQTAILATVRIARRMEHADVTATPGEHCRTCAYSTVCRTTITGDV